jgi:hypothetical protein
MAPECLDIVDPCEIIRIRRELEAAITVSGSAGFTLLAARLSEEIAGLLYLLELVVWYRKSTGRASELPDRAR